MGHAVQPAVGERPRSRFAAVAPRLAFCLVLIGYLAAGLHYNLSNPIWEAPDEPAHYEHVMYLVEHRSLPVRQARVGDQLHQPPLYYFLGSLIVGGFNLDDDLPIKPNPFFIWREDRIGAEPNLAIHTLDEAPPYKGTVLAVHVLRGLTLLMCAVAVVAAYALTRRLLPQRPWLAVAAAGVTAFNPQFLFVSATVGNDGPAIALGSLTLLATVEIALRARRGEAPSWWLFVGLGVVLGLGMLSKLTFFGIVPMVAITALYTLAAARGWRARALGGWGASGAVALALGAWWYLRNLQVYGTTFDIAGAGRFDRRTLVEIQEKPEQMAQILSWYPEPLFQSYWLRFGWMSVYPERWVYDLAIAACALAVTGLALYAVLRVLRREPEDGASTLGLLLCGLALFSTFAITTWRFAYTIGNHYPQGRYLYPAQPATALLLVLGLATVAGLPLTLARWVRADSERCPRIGAAAGAAAALALVAGMGASSLWVVERYLAPSYSVFPIWLKFDPARAPNPMTARFGGQVSLIGYEIEQRQVKAGESLALNLYWRADTEVMVPLQAFVHVAEDSGRPVAQKDDVAGGGYDITRWRKGEVVRDRRLVPIGAEVAPGTYQILVGLYHLKSMERVPLTEPAGATAAQLGTVTVTPR